MALVSNAEYVKIIKKLYGTTMYVDESMISDEVREIVEKILYEIRMCSVNLTMFTSIVNGVVEGLMNAGQSIGSEVVDSLMRSKDFAFIENTAKNFGVGFFTAYFNTWIDVLFRDQRSTICVNTAKLNWKSALAIALLGI